MSSSKAVVVVDLQHDFLKLRGTPAARKSLCIPGAQRLVDHARAHGWRVIHVGTRHLSLDSLPPHQKRRRIASGDLALYCEAGGPGMAFVVEPAGDEEPIWKEAYDAFHGTDLEAQLDGVKQLFVAGVAVDCCVHQTVFSADRLEFETFVPYQAVSAADEVTYLVGLFALSKSACEVVDLEVLLAGGEAEDAVVPQDEVKARAGGWFREVVDTAQPGVLAMLRRVARRVGLELRRPRF